MSNREKLRNDKGFTLVELAIVLVIIGIILGGIIKGQELITNAKIKRAYNAQKEVAAAIYTYYDRYKVYPGDDPQGNARWNNPAITLQGNEGNGLIATAAASTAANFACTATGTEVCNLWSELRQAGILTGSGFTNPTHPYGGAISVTYYSMPTIGGSNAELAHWIQLQNMPYDVCQLLDEQYDDGKPGTAGAATGAGTGSVRGTTDYMNATTGSFLIGFKL